MLRLAVNSMLLLTDFGCKHLGPINAPRYRRLEYYAAMSRKRGTGVINAQQGPGVSGVSPSDPPLAGAIHRYFGSHDAALRAAGIDPKSVRKRRRPWQPEEILTALRGLARDSVIPWPLARSSPGIERAARGYFGSVEAAARAAGPRYVRPPGRASVGHWTAELVLKALRDLHHDGHDLRYRQMKEHSQPLFYAAKQLFGSYVNAVKQAGID
jgi:hypothetical protein